jgi:osmotically-inducible protein OsmY
MGRADARLRAAVVAALIADDALHGAELEVWARDEVVTLRGDVEHPGERERAGRVALYVPGVWRVVNRLRLSPGPPERLADGAAPR